MSHLAFDPLIPVALWAPLALAAIALLATYAVAARRRLPPRRRIVATAMMALGLAIPLAMLLNPVWIEKIPPPAGKPVLTLLMDTSASMATPDGPRSQSRLAAAQQLAAQTARRLGDEFDVRVLTFGADASSVSFESISNLQPQDDVTDLAQAIEASLDERPQGQAALLVSDGAHNAEGGAARVLQSVAKARATAAPVFTVTLGGDAGVTDLEVSLNLTQELSFVGQETPVAVSLRQRGSLAGQAKLSLLLEGQAVDTRDVNLAAEAVAEVEFRVAQSEPGLYRYEVRVEPLPGEATPLNNSALLLLRVVDEPVKLLLLEGKPYWDTKFLVRTLAADPSIELTSLVRLAEGRFVRRRVDRPRDDDEKPASETAPDLRSEHWEIQTDVGGVLSDARSLAAYQIVVLGRDAETYLTDEALAQLKKWLAEENGALVCFRGPPASQISQRLGQLMPLRWTPARESRFRVQLTSTGEALRWLPPQAEGGVLASLPPLATVAEVDRPKPLTVVLATGVSDGDEAAPVISYQPVGSGRVVVVEGAGMWRWAFLPPEYQQHDEVYGRLWRSLVRWLVAHAGLLPTEQAALRADKTTFPAAETASATLLMRDTEVSQQAPQVELTGDSLDRPFTISPEPEGAAPGQFRVVFGKLPEGRYRARLVGEDDANAAAATMFDVRGNLAERLDVAARPDLMQRIAQESGATMLDPTDLEQLPRMLRRHVEATHPPRTVQTPAWDRWWLLTAVLTLWAATWGLRRRSGLT